MLKKLRLRLSIIFTVFACGILATVLTVSLQFSLRQKQQDNILWFSNTITSVMDALMRYQDYEDGVKLHTGPYIVLITQDGRLLDAASPLQVENEIQLTPAQMEAFFSAAKENAQATDAAQYGMIDYNMTTDIYISNPDMLFHEDAGQAMIAAPAQDSQMISVVLSPLADGSSASTVKIEGKTYQSTFFFWQMAQEGQDQKVNYEIAILEDMSALQQQMVLLTLVHIAIFLLGTGLLFAANWQLARLVLRPTQESLARQAEFIAAASHELRSPLAVIGSSLSASSIAPDAATAEKYQAAALGEVERMGHLVDDLLLLAGGDAQSWPMQQAAVDVDTLLIDIAESFRPLAKKKDIELALLLPQDTLPPLLGDEARLRQVLAILLDNALAYAPGGSKIQLSAQATKHKIRISVADNGPGVQDEHKEKVFLRFYRGDESRHEKDHFGLGLSVARELVFLHKGTLEVQDTPGGGATFVITLPQGK